MITLALPDEIELRLKDRAASLGLPVDEYAGRLIIDHLPCAPEITPEALFAQWAAEDPVVDAADLELRNREVEELSAALNKNRRESEGPGARLPCPSK